ncbi:MAG: cellulase family glycosylhydrolase, partial [Planctomycetia bacterium]|nr:cellulase family glycosylhydrolase [Planctomycetia bacterium]
MRISKENPNYFELSDGSPWIAIGVNLCILREYEPGTDIYYTTHPSTVKEFVSSDIGKKYYLDRCRVFANRFKDNPWIFGWEVWNEVNCIPNHYDWTKKVIDPLHEMFPNHLIMQSLGSFDQEKHTQMCEKMMLMPENEVAQVHRYLAHGAQLAICKGPMDKLAVDMVDRLAAYHSGKPILATEMGAVKRSHTGPSELYPLDHEGILFHDILFAPFFAGAAGSGHCWHWANY